MINILNILKHSKLNYFPDKRERCRIAVGEAGSEARGAQRQQASSSLNRLPDRSQITQLCVSGTANPDRRISFMSTRTILSEFTLCRQWTALNFPVKKPNNSSDSLEPMV